VQTEAIKHCQFSQVWKKSARNFQGLEKKLFKFSNPWKNAAVTFPTLGNERRPAGRLQEQV